MISNKKTTTEIIDKIKPILDNNSILSFISFCLVTLLFQYIIKHENNMHATSINKRIINNVKFIEGNFPQLIILIVAMRNINKRMEIPIYNK